MPFAKTDYWWVPAKKDEFIADFYNFMKATVPELYAIKGDISSFLIQAEDPAITNIDDRFRLHSIKSREGWVQDENKGMEHIKHLFLRLRYGPKKKDSWFRNLALYETAINSMLNAQVPNNPTQPHVCIEEANKYLAMTIALTNLMIAFDRTVASTVLRKELKRNGWRVQREFDTLGQTFDETMTLAKQYGYATEMTDEELEDYKEQIKSNIARPV